jgi:glutamine synthetase
VHHHQRLQESFMEGVLMHLPALAAFTLPTVNSYRRVGPGCWTGSSVGWALDDKEVPIRAVPPSVSYSSSSSFSNSLAAESRAAPPSFEHFEYKICDATANLYLALSAIVLAGMHGVRTGATLRAPITTTATPSCDCNAHGTAFTSSLPPALPRSVDEALDYLEADEHLRRQLPSALMQAYVAVRRAEARRSEGATLERELEDALERA